MKSCSDSICGRSTTQQHTAAHCDTGTPTHSGVAATTPTPSQAQCATHVAAVHRAPCVTHICCGQQVVSKWQNSCHLVQCAQHLRHPMLPAAGTQRMAACCTVSWCPLRASPTANPCTVHPVFSLECLLCLGRTSCVQQMRHLAGWCWQRAATGQPQPCTDRKGVHSNRCWAVLQDVLCMQRGPPYLLQHVSAPAPAFLVL